MDILDKNGQFGQKWTFWTKIKNLDKNEEFGQKLTIWANN